MRLRRASVVLSAAISVIAWPVAAHAASVQLTYSPPLPKGVGDAYTLAFTAMPGERNDASFERANGAITVRDAGAPLSVGAGCSRIDATRASCALVHPAPVEAIVELGDGDDASRVGDLQAGLTTKVRGGAGDDRLSTAVNGITLDGGDGADTLIGGEGADQLVGGAHSDVLSGGPGADHLRGEEASRSGALVATAPDVLDGGKGLDTVSYAGHDGPLTVDLAIAGPQAGAGNDLLAGIENLRSEGAGDRLLGDDGANQLMASGRSSTVSGRGGADNLAAPRIDGGAGDDELHVTNTRQFTCGPGEDVIGLTRLRQVIPHDCEWVSPTGRLRVRARPRRVGRQWLELRLVTYGARQLRIRVLDGARGTLLATGPVTLRRNGRFQNRPARLARLRLTRAGRRAFASPSHPLVRIMLVRDNQRDPSGSDGYSIVI